MKTMFDNVNLNVTPHKSLMSSKLPGQEASMFSIYSQMKRENSENVRLESYEVQNKEYDNMQRLAMSSSNKAFYQSYLPNLSNKIYLEGVEVVFKDIMSSIYLESLYLDNDFKEEQKDNLVNFVQEYVESHGGYSMLESAIKTQPTALLQKIKTVCESCSQKSTQRKIQELKESCCNGTTASELMGSEQRFNMNDEEIKEYLDKLDNLSKEEIGDLVKKKVLDVIKDEKQRQQKEEEFEEKLNEEIDNIDISDEDKKKRKDVAKESFNMKFNKNNYSDLSLFESIQCSTMKEAINSAHIQQANDYADDSERGQLEEEEHEEHKLPESGDEILDKDDIVKENNIDMDLILAESISKYTVLEMFNTIQLNHFNRDKVMRLAMDFSKK